MSPGGEPCSEVDPPEVIKWGNVFQCFGRKLIIRPEDGFALDGIVYRIPNTLQNFFGNVVQYR